jgi:thioredoxin-like negative regulator of GroEL
MTIEEYKQQIKTTPALMIYFYSNNCGVCKTLQPKIKNLFDNQFPQITQLYVNTQANQLLCGHLGILSNPTIHIYFDGKIFFNKSRLISLTEIKNSIKRPYDIFF